MIPRVHINPVERWGAGVETQKNVRGEVGGWGRVPFNEPYAPSLSIIYDGAYSSLNFLKMVLDPSPPPLDVLALQPNVHWVHELLNLKIANMSKVDVYKI